MEGVHGRVLEQDGLLGPPQPILGFHDSMIWLWFCSSPPETSLPKMASLAALYSSASSALASLALPGQVISFLSPAGQTKPFLAQY